MVKATDWPANTAYEVRSDACTALEVPICRNATLPVSFPGAIMFVTTMVVGDPVVGIATAVDTLPAERVMLAVGFKDAKAIKPSYDMAPVPTEYM